MKAITPSLLQTVFFCAFAGISCTAILLDLYGQPSPAAGMKITDAQRLKLQDARIKVADQVVAIQNLQIQLVQKQNEILKKQNELDSARVAVDQVIQEIKVANKCDDCDLNADLELVRRPPDPKKPGSEPPK